MDRRRFQIPPQHNGVGALRKGERSGVIAARIAPQEAFWRANKVVSAYKGTEKILRSSDPICLQRPVQQAITERTRVTTIVALPPKPGFSIALNVPR